MNKLITCTASACLVGLCLLALAEPNTQAKPVDDARAQQAKQAIIRFLTHHHKGNTNQVAEWQAIPLTQVSSNEYAYGTYEIDLGSNYFGQMSWNLPIADMGDRHQVAHGLLKVNSNGTWEAQAPSTCTFRMKSEDGQQSPPDSTTRATRVSEPPEK